MKTQTDSTASIIERMALTLECSTPLGGVDGEWPFIGYQCRLIRNGREVWAGLYKLGIGHVKIPKPAAIGAPAWMAHMRFTSDEESMLYSMNSNPHANFKNKALQARLCAKLAIAQKVSPKLSDVLRSLLLDGAALERAFEDWCVELGYDSDSIRALETFQACERIGKALARGFTHEELEELREAFSEY